MKTLSLQIILITGLIMLNSCCEKCELGFMDNERAFLPYEDEAVITFVSENSAERINFKFDRTKKEEDKKQCKGFPERHCYLTLIQRGRSEAPFGTDFLIEISTFREGAFLLSMQMLENKTNYQYTGKVYSGYDVDNEFLPSHDSLVFGDKTFRNVYSITESGNPLVPESLNRITEFHFTKEQGLIAFRTLDENTWILSD
jgi:hypothetical protein